MPKPTMYRNRLIPFESVALSDDDVLERGDSRLITAWKTLKPKPTLAYGYSCYYLDQGFKVSRFYGHEGQFLHWYCDIIETTYDPAGDTYIFTDLLVDVIVMPDGFVRVLDLDELGDALKQQLITPEQLKRALHQCSALLDIIYRGEFETLTAPFLKVISQSSPILQST